MLKISNCSKLKLICEECGFKNQQLNIKKRSLYCNECLEAKERRDRLIQSEKEWNRGVDQNKTKEE